MRQLVVFLALACGGAMASGGWLGGQVNQALDQNDAGPLAGHDETWGAVHLESHQSRRLTEATSFLTVLSTQSDGLRLLQGTVVAFGTESDIFCREEPYICVQTQPCREIPSGRRKVLQQNGLTVAGRYGQRGTAIVTQNLLEGSTLLGVSSNAQPPSGARRRRSLLAEASQQGDNFLLTQTYTVRGTEAGTQPALTALVADFNTGGMNFCRGYSFTGGSQARPGPVDPLRPVQRYTAQVGVGTRGASCQNWSKRKFRRAYVLCASSLTGQPSPFISASCQIFGNPNRRRKNLTITLSVPKTTTSADAQAVLDGLVRDVSDGSFGQCLKARGVNRFQPTVVRSAFLEIQRPRLP